MAREQERVGIARTGQRLDERPRGRAERDCYLSRPAGQDGRRRIARAFVCTAGGADGVPGFNTLSALSMAFGPQPVPARYRVEGRAGRL